MYYFNVCMNCVGVFKAIHKHLYFLIQFKKTARVILANIT